MSGEERDAWRPHGRALLDYLEGRRPAAVRVTGEDGEEELVDAAVFFRGPDEFSALEEAALDLCRGRVLDVGAGAGAHALALQCRGLEVVAIDVAPEAVEVMRRRGVRDARLGEAIGYQDSRPFDTLLLLMNGIGVVGTLAGLERFLGESRRLLCAGGQILLDSYDPGPPLPGAPRDRYPGEMRFRLEYAGRGPFYEWLFVDLDTLRQRAACAGYRGEGIWQEAEGHYLARLTRGVQTVERGAWTATVNREPRTWNLTKERP